MKYPENISECDIIASTAQLDALAAIIYEYAAELPAQLDAQQSERVTGIICHLCDTVQAHTAALDKWLMIPPAKR